jgi:hypothetical protein
MTLEQFSDRVRKRNQWKFLIDMLIAGLAAAAGLFIFYKLYNTDWFERGKPNSTFSAKLIVYGFSVGLIILGIWGIRKVKQDYQVLTIPTDRDKTGNDELISKVADKLNWTIMKTDGITEYLGNTHPVFGYGYEIRILTANKLVHLDIQSLRAGVIDFGDKARLMRKIKSEIAACL